MESNDKEKGVIKFGSKEINYNLTYKDRKTLGIKVYPDTSVKVIAPIETEHEQLEVKLREKAAWILKQQNEFLAYHPMTPERQYVSGETHLYLGKQYKLKIEESEKDQVKLLNGKLMVYTKDNSTVKDLIINWYRTRAEVIFTEIIDRVMPLFSKYKLETPGMQIRIMPTRWGSCTANGKIILNPELVKAHKGCIEYVVIHELCHLIHHSHNRQFYDLQSNILPKWKIWKERLEKTMV